MKLFVDANYLSPYALSVFVALREKNIPFEMTPVNLQNGEHLAAGHARLSRTRRIPCIDDHGFHLSESSAICEYIDEQYPGHRLYPVDRQARAQAREVQAWLRSDLLPIREERSTAGVFFKSSPPPLSPAAEAAIQKLFSAAEALLPAGQDHLFGAWSIADTDLALMLNRLILAGDKVPERLVSFARTQWLRPSIQEWVRLPRPSALLPGQTP
ncbi:glutathione transferase [Zoogloea sp.]|uniref:glutathione transferase n=1 Tax=Zoogloea sp. TaxID=49181 RepID=UPI00261EDA40|nr:glutathione transferase [Zoogloea sp.]MDD3353263.1 glutathione transferase [Zoogloea sp.]